MNILITNDDGICSPVLPLYARWAEKLGNVTIVAPRVEQSGKSQAIDFTRPIEITEVEIAEGVRAYQVDSTPADCVRFATHALDTKFDLILSGINRGFNLGDDIVYSGTCGAIFEGARMGIPGIAISTDVDILMNAPDSLDSIFKYIEEKNLLSYNPLYNINIPKDPKGIRITKQGGMYYCDEFIPQGDSLYIQTGAVRQDSGTDEATDINTVRAGLISVTPLIATRTEMSVFERLSDK